MDNRKKGSQPENDQSILGLLVRYPLAAFIFAATVIAILALLVSAITKIPSLIGWIAQNWGWLVGIPVALIGFAIIFTPSLQCGHCGSRNLTIIRRKSPQGRQYGYCCKNCGYEDVK